MRKEEDPKKPGAIRVENFNLYYGNFQALKQVNLEFQHREVTAIIGPSGCGKSTLLRSINRMNDYMDQVRTEGQIYHENRPVYGPGVDLVEHRKKVGMVFQRPNPFPLTVYENVIFGCRLHLELSRSELDSRVEKSLMSVGLWEVLADHLDQDALSLPNEQQQRLCIARLVAMNPDVLLMDEPCSALDPIATQRIEELIHELKKDYTIIIVTHNMAQAARVSDWTAYFYLGNLIEFGRTEKIFTRPEKKETEDYITGRFG
ncbi:MAG: phosphate ABC transporter ATP-binding protein [Candidatus Omnitrophica bacterium]|nr:phosphate ABC transporter ATP-binding protein [Candidatus Omnitrophota bacterium]